jgi:hypothetical protein
MSQEWLLLDEILIRKFIIAENSIFSKIRLVSQARNMKLVPMEIPLEYRVRGISKKSARAALEHPIESESLFQKEIWLV